MADALTDDEARALGLPCAGPDPRTEAGRANLELQRRRAVCWWCSGGAVVPPQMADRFVRAGGRLRPACRWHADEGSGEEHGLREGLELVLVESVMES